MLNKNALRAEIVRSGITQKELAADIGMSEATFIRRMKTGVFGTDEVSKIVDRLKIEDPLKIFFAKEVN